MKLRTSNFWSLIFKTIINGMVMVLPVIFVGSFAVLVVNFPIPAYQTFISTFAGGAIQSLLYLVQLSTLGLLPVYMTISINLSYTNATQEGPKLLSKLTSLLAALTSFVILSGLFTGSFELKELSSLGLFSALISGVFASVLFQKFEKLFGKGKSIFFEGADSIFNSTLLMVLPYLCVVLIFLIFNSLIIVIFKVTCLQELFIKTFNLLFSRMHRSYFSGFLFTLIISVLWCFGIHGNKVLDKVAVDMFEAIIPAQIVSKTFIDTFVYMGGTGTTLGLVIAMLIFGKTSNSKKLAKMSAGPALFNISEPLIFGYPIIYNPYLIIPFILAPEVCYTFTYLMAKVNFLPPIHNMVNWTVPIFLSGFLATGSVRAIFVQLINLAISVAIYAPFVILYEKKYMNKLTNTMDSLVKILKHSEETTEPVTLTECEGNEGRLAKHLVNDLEESLAAGFKETVSLNESSLLMKYQPQFDNKGKCIGCESLLRWNHAKYGIVYPPLVVHLAKESNRLYELETLIIEKSIHDSVELKKVFGEDFKLSVNITVSSLNDERLLPFLKDLCKKYTFKKNSVCIEITEETALETTKDTAELINQIKSLGFMFALDDFSMGHTSLQYLQYNQFDMVKLDGNLVRSLLGNERTKEIINSIVYLSNSLGFKVLAEFVETTEQQNALEAIGVKLYQGYLYSPAIDKAAFLKMLK
ncbi:MAG: PTS sugar transporter subunit IIC/EAL domain-containing protein [Treponema sp.]|nr:PTS sugar transporter subunit IIC/EAL domain-containing protein [Treponema sp.]